MVVLEGREDAGRRIAALMAGGFGDDLLTGTLVVLLLLLAFGRAAARWVNTVPIKAGCLVC